MKTKKTKEKTVTITESEFVEKCALATYKLMRAHRDMYDLFALTSAMLVRESAIEIFGEGDGNGGTDA